MPNKITEYFTHNPKGYWFKRKLYGWGWTPVRWQGWLTMIIYIAAIVLVFRNIESNASSTDDAFIHYVVPCIVLTFLLIATCYIKGQKPKWQWGEELPDDN